jgi:uncharacterized protein (DUF1778 family)
MYGNLPYITNIMNTEENTPMSRTARLETRLPPDIHALLKRAAEIQGRSVSDFVVTAAQDAARKVIAETEIITLSRAASEQVAALLSAPPEPTPALKRAAAARRRLVASK